MLRKAAALVLCTASLMAGATSQTGPALTVHFEYLPEDFAHIRAIQGRLARALKRSGAGELDDPELHADGNDGYFDIRGPDPDRLYRIVAPVLKSSPLMTNAEVTKRSASGRTMSLLRPGR